MWRLKDQKVVERKDTQSVSVRCLPLCSSGSRTILLATGSEYRALLAPVTGSNDELTEGERCSDLLMVVSSRRQTNMDTSSRRDDTWSVRNEKNFRCCQMDAAATAAMSIVPMLAAS